MLEKQGKLLEMEVPENKVDLVDLSHKLKEVRLFAKSERLLLQTLFSDNREQADRIFQTAWITRQQRHILKKLILASPEAPPNVCCYRANALETVNFIDSYKQLGFQDTLYGEFLAHLRDNPQAIALSLALGEKQNPRESQKTVAVVISSVFGNCIGAEDERRTLLFLQSLMQHQLAESDDPRRLLLKGNCSFCTAFKHFTESLFSSKLYLTAALHDPIMTVLMDDESSLETDPDKAVEQFTNEERLQKFGSPDSDGYQEKLQAHLQAVMGQLVVLCEKFIDGLRSNMFCFPQSLDWIISELHKILVKRGKASVSEVRAMCADLLFNWFICPAIVDPEPFGIISDILVSENARFNLMQIAKILQQLAHLNDASSESGRDNDILNRFEKNCMSSFLDSLINSMKLSDTPPTASDLGGMTQNAALITETDLHRLVSYFRDIVANNPDRSELKEIENCLSTLPTSPQPMSKNLLSPPVLNQGDSPNRHSVTSSVAFKNSVAAKVSSVTKKGRKNTSDSSGDTESEVSDSQSLDAMSVWQQEDVLVVSLGVQSIECPGMLPESKVLATISSKKVLPETETDIPQASLAATSGIPEKHLRFSADASGNSDNMMEAMSIGASNSVYSMDMETDIVSNLSGRNTPRSAISMASSTTEHQRPEIIDSTQLPNSTNITDQFGKFEIEKQNCDIDQQRVMNPEIYSETWSTDVIGSDTSEPPSEANPIEHLKEIAEIQDEEPDLPGAGAGAAATVTILDIQHSDIIETGSETWSVDVLQSDSEFIDDRLQEVEDVAPSEMNLQEAASVESGMEEVDIASSKASEGQSSRRSSASIDRSSSNEMDEAKKEKFLDASDLPPPALPAGMGRQSLNFELTSPSTSSSSILEVPPPLPPRPHKSRDGETGPPLPPRGKQIPPPNPFLTTSGSNSSGFQPLTYTSSPSMRSNSQSILQDFDPLASSSNQGPNPFADSLDGKMQTVKRSLPPGAKPKERPFFPPPPLPSGDSPQDADGTSPSFQPAKTESYNPLYQLHHKGSGFNQYGPSPSQNTIHDNTMNSNISHVNHGFFDPSMTFDPSMDIHQGARNSFPSSEQTSIAPPARFQTSLERPPNLKSKPRNAYSAPIPTNQPVLPLSSGNKDGEGFLNGEVDKEFGSNLIPANMQSRDGDFDGSYYSTDPEVDFNRSTSNDGLDMMESPSDRMAGVGNGEKGKSWFKKKFKQINSKMARSRGSKGGSGQHDLTLSPGLDSDLDYSRKSDDLQVIPNLALVKDGFEDDLKASSVPVNSGEDILNKYRGLRKTQSTEGLDADGLQQDSSADEHSSHSDRPDSTVAEQGSSDLELSSNDGSYAFNDAKRKLQIVLRSADISSMPWLSRFSEETGQRELFMFGGQYPQNELLAFLRALQAEAVNLQDRSLIAQLWETLRCVQSMDNEGCKKLLQSLRDDHERSSVYIAYLIRCRKGLTTTKAHLGRLMERIQRDKDVVNKFFTMVCVRLFLERQEQSIQRFISDFKILTAADEKTQLVKAFLNTLNTWIQQDPIWAAASEEQKIDAEIATERAIMTTVYKLALYPNGDGDIHRDQVLHNHIEKLSKVVSANHKSLQIPEKYQRESPWPAAQAEILNINVYKTPKDKVQCVARCCSIIMNLLSLANENAAPPGADDFVPVLMFVLIKANPPSLLSTVQYVNSFYIENDSYRPGDDSTRGEETYWWMQFVAAIEYMKTMDYRK